MNEFIHLLERKIIDSDTLLEKEIVTEEEVVNFKNDCSKIYISLLDNDLNETINDLAKRGFKYEVKRFKNPIVQWIYNKLTEGKDWITFNAPYLRKRTDSDYYKTYIFWTKKKLEGIIFNLELEIQK